MIKFNQAKIDSFSLLIPLDRVKIVSDYFHQPYAKSFIYTGEFVYKITDDSVVNENDKSFYDNYQKGPDNGTRTFLKYKVIKRVVGKHTGQEFLQVMLTSKLLGSQYFDGINESNIDLIYNRIISDRVVYLDRTDFLNGLVTDIDICKDFKLGESGFKNLKRYLLEYALIEKKSFLDSRSINGRELFGIVYNDRHKATPSKPFAKLYYKTRELVSEKTYDFYEANLGQYVNDINEGISRIEVTIKDYAHRKKLNIDNIKSLKDLLSVSVNDLESLFSSVFNEYYDCNLEFRMRKRSGKMNSNDLALLTAIEIIFSMNRKITSSELMYMISKNSADKKQRFTIKQKVKNLISISEYENRIASNDKANEEAVQVMQSLGIFS